jgi:hypothetical protein
VTEIRRSRSGRASASVTVITIILPRPGTAEPAAVLAHAVNPRVGQADGGCRGPGADSHAEPVAGTARASRILGVLQGQGSPTCLGRALAEYGRIAKTLHLLAMLADDPYRPDMAIQLQEHEHRHRVARDFFHGQRGRLRQRYRQGQEDQLSALGLVLNAIVIWNTTYMTDAIKTLDAAPRAEDLQRLSPLASSPSTCSGATASSSPIWSKAANADPCASSSVNSAPPEPKNDPFPFHYYRPP